MRAGERDRAARQVGRSKEIRGSTPGSARPGSYRHAPRLARPARGPRARQNRSPPPQSANPARNHGKRGGFRPAERKRVVSGKRVSVRVDHGGRRIIKTKQTQQSNLIKNSQNTVKS